MKSRGLGKTKEAVIPFGICGERQRKFAVEAGGCDEGEEMRSGFPTPPPAKSEETYSVINMTASGD